MNLSPEEEEIRDRAIEFARKNKKRIARELTSPDMFTPEAEPVSVFMAGSPGAGKTEASVRLLEETKSQRVIRIDPDDLRTHFEEYDGNNSWLFQPAASILVEKMVDLALDRKQSFLLDGTLSSYTVARKNIKRSLSPKRRRFTQIIYVYQDPVWLGSLCKLVRLPKEGAFQSHNLSSSILRPGMW